MSNPPRKNPPTVVYQTEFHGKKLAIAVERHNWIIVHCKAGTNPLKSDDRWYFSDPAAMLLAVHKYLLKERVKRLGFDDFAQVVRQSYDDVEKLGRRLVVEIADNAGYGALPRFPCDHVVERYRKEIRG